MNREYLFPFRFSGKVNAEYFVKTTAPHEFRRQYGYVVGGGDYEHGGGFVIEPCQQVSEKPLGYAGFVPAHSGKGFFNLVHPQHAGACVLRQTQGAAQLFFALTQILAHQGSQIKAKQRYLVHIRDCLRGKALAAAGHTHKHYALGRLYAVFIRFARVENGVFLFTKPPFQMRKPAYIIFAGIRFHKFQQTTFAYSLFFGFLGYLDNLLRESVFFQRRLFQYPLKSVLAHPFTDCGKPVCFRKLYPVRVNLILCDSFEFFFFRRFQFDKMHKADQLIRNELLFIAVHKRCFLLVSFYNQQCLL